jgi:hypothetical protein
MGGEEGDCRRELSKLKPCVCMVWAIRECLEREAVGLRDFVGVFGGAQYDVSWVKDLRLGKHRTATVYALYHGASILSVSAERDVQK